jgi:hypothetical protein
VSTNLWPDFKLAPDTKSPKSIVEGLSEGLDEKTEGLVRFESNRSIKNQKVQVTFSFYAPRLGYGFPFLKITFPIDKFYPVTIDAEQMETTVAQDENELVHAIANLYKAPSTIAIVERLMSLANNL